MVTRDETNPGRRILKRKGGGTHRRNNRNLITLLGAENYEEFTQNKRLENNDNPIVRLFYGNFISTLATRKIGFVGASRSNYIARKHLLQMVNGIIGDSNKKVLIKDSTLHSSQRVAIVDISLHQNSVILPSYRLDGFAKDQLRTPGWASRRLQVVPFGHGFTVFTKAGEALIHFEIHIQHDKKKNKKTLLDYQGYYLPTDGDLKSLAQRVVQPRAVRNIGKFVRTKALALHVLSRDPANELVPKDIDIFKVTKFKSGGINKKNHKKRTKLKLIPTLLHSILAVDFASIEAEMSPEILQTLLSLPQQEEENTPIQGTQSYRVTYHKQRRIMLVYNKNKVLQLQFTY